MLFLQLLKKKKSLNHTLNKSGYSIHCNFYIIKTGCIAAPYMTFTAFTKRIAWNNSNLFFNQQSFCKNLRGHSCFFNTRESIESVSYTHLYSNSLWYSLHRLNDMALRYIYCSNTTQVRLLTELLY